MANPSHHDTEATTPTRRRPVRRRVTAAVLASRPRHLRWTPTLALAIAALLGSGCLSVLASGRSVDLRASARSSGAAPLQTPPLSGSRDVGTVAMRLLDRSRADRSSPSGVRELMVQIWYPAQSVAGYAPAPYVPAKTAGLAERYYRVPDHTLTRLLTRAYAAAPVALGEHPVLIYSPGLGDMRSDDTALLENLASDGYIVAAVDHTHEAQWVQFPGGRMVPWSGPYTVSSPFGSTPTVTKRRVVDVRFVLDELTRLNQTARFRGRFNLSQIGAFGFSLGGSTAASAMQLDPRLKAGADLDGAIHEPALSGGLRQPFMIMQDPTARNFAPLRTFVRHLRGPHLVLELAKSKHTAFNDDVWLKQTLHTVAPRLAGTIDPGAISPDLALAAESTYLNAFFATYLSHRPSSLLAEPSPAFPVITFVR